MSKEFITLELVASDESSATFRATLDPRHRGKLHPIAVRLDGLDADGVRSSSVFEGGGTQIGVVPAAGDPPTTVGEVTLPKAADATLPAPTSWRAYAWEWANPEVAVSNAVSFDA